jgi:hypothetical protein
VLKQARRMIWFDVGGDANISGKSNTNYGSKEAKRAAFYLLIQSIIQHLSTLFNLQPLSVTLSL